MSIDTTNQSPTTLGYMSQSEAERTGLAVGAPLYNPAPFYTPNFQVGAAQSDPLMEGILASPENVADGTSGTPMTGLFTLGDGVTAPGVLRIVPAPGKGDSYISAGKTKFDNTELGFILGIQDATSTAKFYLGNSTNYLNWDGANLLVSGTLVATTGIIGGWAIGATTLSSGLITIDSANKRIIINDGTKDRILIGYQSGGF